MARNLAALMLYALIYVLLAKLGLSLATLHGNVSPVWPPTGYAIALLLLGGRRLWPSVFMGAFIANALTSISPGAAFWISVGNTLEALAASTIISRDTSHSKLVREVHQAATVVVGACVGSVISAVVVTSSLIMFGQAQATSAVDLVVTWFTGDLLGALILVPLLSPLKMVGVLRHPLMIIGGSLVA